MKQFCRGGRRATWLLPGLLAWAGAAPAALPIGPAHPPGPANAVTTEQVRAELVAHAPAGLAPGQSAWLGLALEHAPQWHTYWKNPGDSGLPTQLAWTLPKGLTVGDIAWPVPAPLTLSNMVNYGYEGALLLAVPLTVAPGFRPAGGQAEVKLKASWLVCRLECIPQEGEFTLRLPATGAIADHAAQFERALAQQPQALAADGRAVIAVQGGQLAVTVQGLPADAQGQALRFLPELPELIEHAAPITQRWQGDTWTAQVPLSRQRSASPTELAFVLSTGEHAALRGWRAQAPVHGAWPTPGELPGAAVAGAAALDAQGASRLAVLSACIGALIGGLLLNLMPCVFPVLAIKVMGFAQAGAEPDRRRRLRHQGVAYTAGVLVSFLGLGGLLLALRAGGEQLGWGFQLQSPAAVAALAVLFTLIALNLLGVFEVGTWVPGRVAGAQPRHPGVNAGLSGVLAVAVASPCTAPFMGASLGLAVTLPAWQALAVFAAIGLGMALPYLLISLVPALARHLPRPGPWMDVLRRFMAFPMLATVVWLLWVHGQQTGIDGVTGLLAVLLLLALAAWAVALRPGRPVLAGVSLLLLAAGALYFGPSALTLAAPEAEAPQAVSSNAPDSGAENSVSTGGIRAIQWQPWAPGKVEQLLAQGQPVFVDFTAAWCITCQYNKKTTLADAAVLADFAAHGVALLRADWTRRDPAITAALAQLGRSGVPVYVLHRAGVPPRVLNEVLSVAEVRAALAAL